MLFRVLLLIGIVAGGYYAFKSYGYRYVLEDIRSNANTSMVMGNVNAPINILAYVDYESDSSKQLHAKFVNLVSSNPNVSILIRPAEGTSAISQLTNRIVFAAEKKGRFFDLHNVLMSSNRELNEYFLELAVQSLNMNYNQLKSEALSADIETEITHINGEIILLNIENLPQYYIEHVEMLGAGHSLADINKIIVDLEKGRL